jgi:hypothetical protein
LLWTPISHSLTCVIAADNRLLRLVSPAVSARLAPQLHTADLARGFVLSQPEQTLTDVYFPESGLISLVAVYSCGGAIEMAAVGR